MQIGTVEGDRRLVEMMPREVQLAVQALETIAERLPRDPRLPAPPTAEEIEKAVEEQGKKSQKEDPE